MSSFVFQTVKAIYDRTFPAEEYDSKDVDDNCGLMYLNEATLLNNLRMRYMKNKIYVSNSNYLRYLVAFQCLLY